MTHFVIIGAGQAGASLVATLRNEGFDGKITLIGAEPSPPYQRPPLSKSYLLGEMARERLFIRPLSWYESNGIKLRTDTRVTSVDPVKKIITLESGEMLTYDQMVFTTGAQPRTLPASIGGTLEGAYAVRNLSDVDAMAPEFQSGRRALIIGGGYIGLEAAAVAAKLGLKVLLVEMAERILQRVAAPQTSDFFRNLHTGHGVEIRESVGLEKLLGHDRVDGARLTDGSEFPIDFAIIGVGVTPATQLAEEAGITCDNGIVTDPQGRTSDPNIWAAGDCATLSWNGAKIRLESVGNAIDQAELVARNMLGANELYRAKPWFWSDQYDVKLQIAGLNTGYTDIIQRQTGNALSHWYFKDQELIAIDAMNDPRAYMIGKRLIESGKSPAKAAIADPTTDMKALLAQ